MVTPPKGDYLGIPLTAAAKKIADAWDPDKDQASGDTCKAYGAAAILSLPERLHITWQDDNTLRLDLDSGTQTRLFHFGAWKPEEAKSTRQGDSLASWIPRRGAGVSSVSPSSRYLKVRTTHMLPGYLRKNGVPYSENAVLTEYFDMLPARDADPMLIVTTMVEDPIYLDNPLILTAQFKKIDASAWEPTPCSAK